MPGNGPRPPVYAIVVNYNGWRDTLECLESLLRSDYSPLRVIVCDSASTDDSVEKIRGWASGEVAAPATSDAQLAQFTTPPLKKPLDAVVCTAEELLGTNDINAAAKVIVVRCPCNLGFAAGNNVGLSYVIARERNASVAPRMIGAYFQL